MASITTDDCKKKLVELYPDTQVKAWKRTKKYLNSRGEVERVFECAQVRTAVLCERAGQLFEVIPPLAPQMTPIATMTNTTTASKLTLHPLPTGLVTLSPTTSMNRLLFGATGPEKLSLPFVSSYPQETQFLLVLQNTIDWNAPEKLRSSYDFAKSIDFNNFVARCTVQGIDLIGSYLMYMAHQIEHFAGLDEETFFDISAIDYDDSLADVLAVFQRMEKAFFDKKWHAPLAREFCDSIAKSTKTLKNSCEQTHSTDDEEAQDVFVAIDKVLALCSRAV